MSAGFALLDEHQIPQNLQFLVKSALLHHVLDKNQLHRLKVKISSLLSSKNPQTKCAALILARHMATHHKYGASCLESHALTWLKLSLVCIHSRESSRVRRIAIITISSVLSACDAIPTLVREVVTPTLSRFLILLSEEKTDIALEAAVRILRHHPTTFRPFSQRFYEGIVERLAGREDVSDVIYEGFVSMSYCAAKGQMATVWRTGIDNVIHQSHIELDTILISLHGNASARHESEKPGFLPRSTEFLTCLRRFARCTGLIEKFASVCTPVQVRFPIGHAVVLARRVLTLTLEFPNSASRGERELLESALPLLRINVVNTMRTLVLRALFNLATVILDKLQYHEIPRSIIQAAIKRFPESSASGLLLASLRLELPAGVRNEIDRIFVMHRYETGLMKAIEYPGERGLGPLAVNVCGDKLEQFVHPRLPPLPMRSRPSTEAAEFESPVMEEVEPNQLMDGSDKMDVIDNYTEDNGVESGSGDKEASPPAKQWVNPMTAYKASHEGSEHSAEEIQTLDEEHQMAGQHATHLDTLHMSQALSRTDSSDSSNIPEIDMGWSADES